MHIPLEKLLLSSGGSIYKLAILAAKRAIFISEGGKCLLEKPGEKCLDNALKEIASGLTIVKEEK